MREDHLAAAVSVERGKDLGRDRIGCTIGAVDNHAVAIERETWNRRQQKLRILSPVGLVDQRRNLESFGRRFVGRGGKLNEYLVLNRQLGCVSQLVAVRPKQLNAIVLPWIVRGGNDDSCTESVRARQ